jgi:monoamine oxidase
MARTRAFSSLRRSLLLALRAERLRAPTREIIEESRHVFRAGRREFLKGASATALSAYTLSGCADRSDAGDTHVGIVGAGMAGLLCAYRLKQAGVHVTVFDAGKRTGGRMYTARGKLAGGQLAELGGELIDTDHATLRRVAGELGLQLDDLHSKDDEVREETFFFGGKVVSEAAIVEAFVPVAKRMVADLAASEDDDDKFDALDAMSIEAWLDGISDLDPTLRSILSVAYTGEYGREIGEQSVFNLLWLIDAETPDPFRIFGDSDERFHCHEGSGAIPDALTKKLGDAIQLEHGLVRAKKLSDGRMQLTLDKGGKSIEERFDKIVLALPWTMLRDVELDVGLSKDKQAMIQELGYGQNAKIMGQTSSRVWLAEHKASGSAFLDSAPQTTWDSARGQAGKQGILTVFVGGKEGVASGQGTPEARMEGYLPHVDAMFPGVKDAYVKNSALRMHWPSAPLFLGSYACFLPGQATWSGTEGEASGNVHFCGEHTSEDFQGYMEGAAESGERVADEIFKDLGLT